MSRQKIKRVRDLFCEFRQLHQDRDRKNTGKLNFAGVGGHDVYNITAPFSSAGKTIVAGRVEPRCHEYSATIFFEETDNIWSPVPDAPTFELQDPFVTCIRGELIFGGVEITNVDGFLAWKTIFFRGPDIFNLTEFFRGPTGMKDIRLCDLENGRIAVFTRPQGEIGGRGIIGYTEVNRLEDLTIDVIWQAGLLEGMFHPLDWGGVNEALLLANGEIGVLAHAAHYENDDMTRARYYHATSFVFDPLRREFRDYKIIACRDQFEDGPAKEKFLTDVIFSSGLIRNHVKTILYAGVSDAEAHWIEIENPFPIEEQRVGKYGERWS